MKEGGFTMLNNNSGLDKSILMVMEKLKFVQILLEFKQEKCNSSDPYVDYSLMYIENSIEELDLLTDQLSQSTANS